MRAPDGVHALPLISFHPRQIGAASSRRRRALAAGGGGRAVSVPWSPGASGDGGRDLGDRLLFLLAHPRSADA